MMRRAPQRERFAAQFAFSELHTAALAQLSATGFAGASANAASVLAELLQRFLHRLADVSGGYASLANRSEIAPWDVCASLEEMMGDGYVQELAEWAQEEGIWRREHTPRTEAIDAQLGRLRAFLGRGPAAEDTVLRFEKNPDDVRVLEAEACAEQVQAEGYLWGESVPEYGVPAGDKRPVDTPALPYVPEYLPPMPEIVPKQEPVPDEGAVPAPRDAPRRRAALLPVLDEEDGVRRVWKQCAANYENADLPSVERLRQMRAKRHPGARAPDRRVRRSSLRAFEHALEELGKEPTTRLPVFLTNALSGTGNASTLRETAFKRRRLAHCFADASRFAPRDSIHGCVNVHPTSPAWVPGPSLLITMEGKEELSEPVFTAVHPHGRVAGIGPPAGALYPTLSYRHPAHLYMSLQMVAYPELMRTVTRTADPPALLDDHRTERVFHGMAVSRDLLTGTMASVQHRNTPGAMIDRYRGGNSILHATLERLRFLAAHKAAQQRAEMDGGEQAEQQDREPIRGERIRLPRSGTLVYSWDWRPAVPGADEVSAQRPGA